MSSILDRLRSGRRWWAAEIVLRFGGVGLLALGGQCAQLAHHWVVASPSHQASPGEFGMVAASFGLLTAGLALSFEGPELFRLVPIPKHSAFFRSGDL